MSAIISISPTMPLVKNILVEEAIKPVQYFIIFRAYSFKKLEIWPGFARSGFSNVKNYFGISFDKGILP